MLHTLNCFHHFLCGISKNYKTPFYHSQLRTTAKITAIVFIPISYPWIEIPLLPTNHSHSTNGWHLPGATNNQRSFRNSSKPDSISPKTPRARYNGRNWSLQKQTNRVQTRSSEDIWSALSLSVKVIPTIDNRTK